MRSRDKSKLVVISSDDSLLELASEAARTRWELAQCGDAPQAGEMLNDPNVGLVIVDDECIEDSMRGWLLSRINRYAARALVIYVAASHSPEREKRARAHSVQYYTSKPLDHDRTLRVIRSFMRARG